MRSSILASMGLSALAAAAPVELVDRQTICYSGAFVINLHGCGTQGAGVGREGAYSSAIVNGIPNSSRWALDYDGNCSLGYFSSLNQGVAELKRVITTYANRCPNSKIIIVGYSEGAHVTLNTLGGVQSSGANPLPSQYQKNIAAVVLAGDPSRAPGQSYNAGNNVNTGGVFQRQSASLNVLATYASKIRSFCDSGDEFCAPLTDGPDGVDVHGSYFDANHYVNNGVAFAINSFKA